MVNIPPMAKGAFHLLNGYNPAIVQPRGFEIRYDSLGGIGYITTVTWVNEEMRTVFAPE